MLGIISGVPRSGTSVAMLCVSKQYGEDNIIGGGPAAFEPVEPPENLEQKEDWPELMKRSYGVLNYGYKKRLEIQKERKIKRAERSKKTKDMNPRGFWECGATVSGVRWNYSNKEDCKKWLAPECKKYMKIVSQGLLPSDPRFIGKIVYTLRSPREVAKSQERLSRGPEIEVDGQDVNVAAGLKKDVVHSPKHFMSATINAAKFFLENPEIPVHFYKYNDLIENPKKTLNKIFQFLSGQNAKKAAVDCIDTTLQRSKAEDIPHELWEDAEKIYEWICAGEFQKIIDYAEDVESKIYTDEMRIQCFRLGRPVNKIECQSCLNDPQVTAQFRKTARANKINFLSEPCAYECGFNPDSKPKTVEESIKENHWLKEAVKIKPKTITKK